VSNKRLFSLCAAIVAVLATTWSASAATNVAVFNFQMTSDTPDWRWLEKGLADRIATDFVQDRNLSVVARDQMQVLAQQMAWVPEMAKTDAARMGEVKKQLKIAHLVTGVYEVTGDQIRLVGQVVEVEARQEVARKEIEGPAAEVLDLQRRLSAELLSWFSKKPAAQILKMLPVWTRSLPAAKALYEGMDLYDQGRYAEGWLRFRQASREDPDYVEARYWVAKMYYFMRRYAHARRALEQFVYLDTTHPRLGDAMIEYVHTYEATGAPADALLLLYADLAKRFPNAAIWQGRSWGHFGDLRSDDWFRFKRIHLLTQIGRHEEVVRMSGPLLTSGTQWYPDTEPGCGHPYGLVNLMAYHEKTGKMAPFKIVERSVVGDLSATLGDERGKAPWLRFDEKGSAVTVRTAPRRLIGKEATGHDRTAVFDVPSAVLSMGLRAPSGYVFTSLHFTASGEGKDGYLEIKLRRPDNWKPPRGYAPPERAPFTDACSKGILFTAPPRLGMLIAECRFAVNGPKSGPIHIKGVTVKPTLAPIHNPGTLDVSCRNTSDFCVHVDGALMRWYPGQVGPLSPGTHEVRFVPVGSGTPYGESSMIVTVRSGQATPVLGHLPWAQGSPWASWTSAWVPAARPAPDPSLWHRRTGRPAIQADDEALRLVWSFRGDLWASESTDGKRFSSPRKLDLPVSSGWNEFAPRLVRHETGRLVLTFLSDRDGQHRNLPYVCWSRDFIHWSRPSLIVDESVPDHYDLLRDDRGRLILVYRGTKTRRALVSSDMYRWATETLPGHVLMQDRTGGFHAYDLVRKKGETYANEMVPHAYELYGWTSPDLHTWSERRLLGKFGLDGEFPSTSLFAFEDKSGPLLLGFGLVDRWGVGLCEPGENGEWRVTSRAWGLLPGSVSAAYHPRWGYLMAALSEGNHGLWPRERCGPYLLRGPDLDPLRQYRNPLPPLAYRKEKEVPAKKEELADKIAPTISLGHKAIGKPFQAIKDWWKPPSASKAPVGTLTYVYAFCGKRSSLEGSQHFRPARPGCGTVHPKARVVTVDVGGRKMALALDAEQPDAQQYDIVRLDLTGKGDFRSALQIPRIYFAPRSDRSGQKKFVYEFVADFPAMTVGERKMAAGVIIDYKEGAALGSATELGYRLSTCAVGECRFGDRTYKVRFYDYSGNLSVCDPARPRREGEHLAKDAWGDGFCVDVHQDADSVQWFTNVTGEPIRYDGRRWRINRVRMPQAQYGQLVLVDRRWWDVRVSADGCHVTAEPYEGPMAHIRLDHPFWQLTLIGDDVLLNVHGGEGPVPIPAGRYRLETYWEYVSPTPSHYSASLLISDRVISRVDLPTFDLKAGTTTPIRLGSPLRGTMTVTQKEGSLHFSIDLNDAGGRGVYVPRFRDGEPSSNVRVKIALAAQSGQQAMTFEASRYEAGDRGWKIPPGFRGTYTATVEFPPDTFPIEVKPVRVTVR